MPWVPKPDAFRAARERLGLTLDEAAERTGVRRGTLWEVEAGNRATVRQSTLVAAARGYGVDKEVLATLVSRLRRAQRWRADDPAAGAGSTAAGPAVLPPASDAQPAQDPVRCTWRTIESLRAAPRAMEGRRMVVIGRVDEVCPLVPMERIALGSTRAGVGARFDVELVPRGGRVSVHTIAGGVTRQLQNCVEAGMVAWVRVRVVVVTNYGEHVTWSGEEAADVTLRKWKGFSQAAEGKPVPWALVVERVDTAPAPTRAKSRMRAGTMRRRRGFSKKRQ